VGYLKNKIITVLLFLAPLVSYGQWSYTFTDPCTLNQQTIQMGSSDEIALNYFGNVQTFTQPDFTDGTFDAWMNLVTQANSANPCQGVTQAITNNTNAIVVQNTITVITNIMNVLGGDMLPQALSASGVPVAEAIDNANKKKKKKKKKKNKSDEQSSTSNGESSSSGSESGSSSNESGSSNSESGGSDNKNNENSSSGTSSGQSNGSGSSETSGGQGNTGGSGTSTGGAETATEEESKEGALTMSLANSVSNAIDGGDADNKNRGSLIASGDIVVIDNQDNSNGRQVKVVGSITSANTKKSRVQGALFTYTTVTNDFSLTFYKSWINPNRTFNLVGANTTMTDFNQNHLNTTTVLESFKFGKKKFTGMAGLNFTVGKLGKRELQNLSAVTGVHRNFRVSPKITTSALILGVYSPFTQYYEGKWWDPGLLIVPFSSWDIQITKTFKYNISFTGVWQSGGNALNYQILTGGKIRF
jgi:hypothetical protein